MIFLKKNPLRACHSGWTSLTDDITTATTVKFETSVGSISQLAERAWHREREMNVTITQVQCVLTQQRKGRSVEFPFYDRVVIGREVAGTLISL